MAMLCEPRRVAPARLELAAGAVHLWRACLDYPDMDPRQLEQVLSPDERARAERFHFPHDRLRFIAARGILRLLLGAYLDRAPDSPRFSYGPHGKPALIDNPAGLSFNVSHSHDLALFAVTLHRRLGVDVERVRPLPDAEQIVERFFSPGERAAFRALPHTSKQAQFFNYWTRKEALLKALGAGLAFPMESVEVATEPETWLMLKDAEDAGTPPGWMVRTVTPGTGFAAALAVEGREWRLSCFQWPDPAPSPTWSIG